MLRLNPQIYNLETKQALLDNPIYFNKASKKDHDIIFLIGLVSMLILIISVFFVFNFLIPRVVSHQPLDTPQNQIGGEQFS